MSDIQIKYVKMSSGGTSHEHIEEVGNDSGMWAVSSVVVWIESKTHTFFTFEGGKRADVAVRSMTLANGTTKKYLQTHADGYWKNNLVNLPAPPKKAGTR